MSTKLTFEQFINDYNAQKNNLNKKEKRKKQEAAKMKWMKLRAEIYGQPLYEEHNFVDKMKDKLMGEDTREYNKDLDDAFYRSLERTAQEQSERMEQEIKKTEIKKARNVIFQRKGVLSREEERSRGTKRTPEVRYEDSKAFKQLSDTGKRKHSKLSDMTDKPEEDEKWLKLGGKKKKRKTKKKRKKGTKHNGGAKFYKTEKEGRESLPQTFAVYSDGSIKRQTDNTGEYCVVSKKNKTKKKEKKKGKEEEKKEKKIVKCLSKLFGGKKQTTQKKKIKKRIKSYKKRR